MTDLSRSDDPLDDAPVGDDSMDEQIETSNDFRPASAALTFIHDGAAVRYTVDLAAYAAEPNADGQQLWRRRPMEQPQSGHLDRTKPRDRFTHNGVVVEVASRWRSFGDHWMVTVSVENTTVHTDQDGPVPSELCLFQVSLRCAVDDGCILPYRTTASLDRTHEEEELDLRYSDKRVYAVGHGCSVQWDLDGDGVRSVGIDFLPMVEVPAVSARGGESPVLHLRELSDDSTTPRALVEGLESFVKDYEHWIDRQAISTRDLIGADSRAAERLLQKQRDAAARMHGGIALLESDDVALKAFRLAMSAMRTQMQQTRHLAGEPRTEPTWRPFQLGFLLTALASTARGNHPDRETVDLIWFPTGGGKTEAYLALAAFEMCRRRLTRGRAGGGTAVITRYTLRLLTTQQFQRAATLICALELQRKAGLIDGPAFTIGLWLGASTTPNDIKGAKDSLEAAYKQSEPQNPFQLEACPWCGTAIFPDRRTEDRGQYGAEAGSGYFKLFCPNGSCEFHSRLPVLVVDEQIYAEPPTMLVATIDKFARLPVLPKAGSLFGLETAVTDPPSLIIQDELHLLSGPLGTTMGLYEAAIESLISWSGTRPKIVASTATVRAAEDQVRGLFASPVEVYPPAGVSADDSYFAQVERSKPGRLYLGLMPQAFTQATSVVRSLTALLEAPATLTDQSPDAIDSYWTVVVYHNSLRELGRTVTIARDDVENALISRGGDDARTINGTTSGGVRELTSRIPAADLPGLLRALDRTHDTGQAIDVVACTNMLSVGIDVPRLGVMLMNGQPKTTSEYIQATSRVGRGAVPGVVLTLFRATKPRDRSHYETFRAYHEALYRAVEPTSVTPWTMQSRRRALAAALVILVRHGAGLRDNTAAANFDPESFQVRAAIEALKRIATVSDPSEAAASSYEIDGLVTAWAAKVGDSASTGGLTYNGKLNPLLKNFGELGDAWPVMNSMRDVDRAVRIIARGEDTVKK